MKFKIGDIVKALPKEYNNMEGMILCIFKDTDEYFVSFNMVRKDKKAHLRIDIKTLCEKDIKECGFKLHYLEKIGSACLKEDELKKVYYDYLTETL